MPEYAEHCDPQCGSLCDNICTFSRYALYNIYAGESTNFLENTLCASYVAEAGIFPCEVDAKYIHLVLAHIRPEGRFKYVREGIWIREMKVFE